MPGYSGKGIFKRQDEMKSVLSVGLGGVLGALARYYIYTPLNLQSVFPWGTLAVNLAGSFFLAFFLTLALRHLVNRSLLVLTVSTGFTGSFTTFSTLSLELVKLSGINAYLPLIYTATSFTAGLLLAYSGRYLGGSVSSLIDRRLNLREAGKKVE